ncbi:APC family permease [Francisella tularensis subsp. novicida]|uniref:APC family permease n=1 Tax=Francisella tularensis TaxID=263 RepID=UPI000503764A|nr:APC family permease [Francisella tularensis]AJI44870.1 amino acid permease family protein [Francisella tularensis subsp. novicida F6168]AJJ47802.1 amino acid permease family protein [Francisella tularensis subsp. novicida]APC98662.1 amino acid permease family protein [Francisella tularensis subsp. novicida]KFJ67703.1 amino acid permease family protein [Francisella tularensis subsp. novicida]MBK2109758.1 APC family permease [Francisella tularensis subsp. novicida FSC595]
MKIKNLIFGSPIPNAKQQEQKIGLFAGFAILSSNALSSVSYATGEIFIVLATAGAAAVMQYSIEVSIMVILLILLMGFSYAQVIRAHPEGGGSYSIVKTHFNEKLLLLTSASLIIDYILTVAVSVSTAAVAISSALPVLDHYSVKLALGLLALLMIINLRGVKSTAKIFIWPTYMFIVSIIIMIIVGIYQYNHNSLQTFTYTQNQLDHMQASMGVLTITLLLRAFSSGSAALTGIESYANGVSAYKSPTLAKSIIGLLTMTFLSIVMFAGVTFIAAKTRILPDFSESVLSQVAHQVLGNGFLYYFLQASTCLILLMAANTCFTGFPILASIMSKDNYLPEQLQRVGDRFAFRNGIIMLTILSAILVIIFDAKVSLLIPLYAFGVFIAFTLCQAGLVKYWYRNKRKYKSWGIRAFINAFGCVATFVVLITIVESKFFEGVWIIIIAIAIIMYGLYAIKTHYIRREHNLALSVDEAVVNACIHENLKPKIVVLVSRIHRGTIEALRLARNLSDDITPVFVSANQKKIEKIKSEWKNLAFKEKLLIMRPVYNSFITPVLQILHKNDLRDPERGYSVVIIPEVVNTKWWHFLLHNQNSRMVKLAIAAMDKKDDKTATRVVISVPYKAE